MVRALKGWQAGGVVICLEVTEPLRATARLHTTVGQSHHTQGFLCVKVMQSCSIRRPCLFLHPGIWAGP